MLSSAQAIDYLAMLLLLADSKVSMVTASDVGWMSSFDLLLVACCMLCFVLFNFRAALFLSFFPILFSFFFHVFSSLLYLSLGQF